MMRWHKAGSGVKMFSSIFTLEDISVKKKLIRLLLMFMIIFTVSGCTKSKEPEDDEAIEEQTDKDSKKKKDKKNKVKPDKEQEEALTMLDITSEESVMSFICGEWKLMDTLNVMSLK